MDQYLKSNRSLWDQWASFHPKTSFYDMKSFLNGRNALRSIERKAIGDVDGKSLLHLQCHFGQDSLSWARMGAKVTGVDFSGKAIAFARELNKRIGTDARFIQSDVLALKGQLEEPFDIVFTSYGVLVWLPDLKKWGEVISHHLKPGGLFYMVEFHPGMMMFDFDSGKYRYPYFHEETPIEEIATGSYADPSEGNERVEFTWQHSLSEIMMALINQGLEILEFDEYDYSPYDCFPGMEKIGEEKYQVKSLSKAPHLFAIKARKKTLQQ
jgi:SAM-dependent methyltransferase